MAGKPKPTSLEILGQETASKQKEMIKTFIEETVNPQIIEYTRGGLPPAVSRDLVGILSGPGSKPKITENAVDYASEAATRAREVGSDKTIEGIRFVLTGMEIPESRIDDILNGKGGLADTVKASINPETPEPEDEEPESYKKGTEEKSLYAVLSEIFEKTTNWIRDNVQGPYVRNFTKKDYTDAGIKITGKRGTRSVRYKVSKGSEKRFAEVLLSKITESEKDSKHKKYIISALEKYLGKEDSGYLSPEQGARFIGDSTGLEITPELAKSLYFAAHGNEWGDVSKPIANKLADSLRKSKLISAKEAAKDNEFKQYCKDNGLKPNDLIIQKGEEEGIPKILLDCGKYL